MRSLMTARRAVAFRKNVPHTRTRMAPSHTSCTSAASAARDLGHGPVSPVIEQRTVFMFAGEGSQYFQMGAELYEQHPLFRKCMQDMDEIVRELCGYSVLQLLYEQGYGKSETFDRTLLSHPAIFMVQYATSRVLISAGITPDLTMGTGVGSFAAAAVARHIGMEGALIALLRQAAMFETRCELGGMLAVRHDPALYESPLRLDSEIACFNLPGHYVVAAKHDALRCIEETLRSRGVPVQKLAVPFAFHSRWVDEARDPFARFMQSMTRRRGSIPMMCSFGAELLAELPADYFWCAMREPVRLNSAIQRLECEGTFRYIDVGPSDTLSTIVTHTLARTSGSTARATLTPFGQDLKNIAALIESGG